MSDDDDSNRFGVSRNIMFAAILSLLTVVTLIILLHLYARRRLRRQERRRQEMIHRLHQQIEPHVGNSSTEPVPKRGLDPLVIASLPMFTYKPAADGYYHEGESLECSVCLGTVVEAVMVRTLPNCKHMFHVECIDMWLESHTTCPVCRTAAEPTVLSKESPQDRSEQPSAPPLEANIVRGGAQSEKVGGSGSRLGSFRWMLNRERSSRTQRCGEDDPERR